MEDRKKEDLLIEAAGQLSYEEHWGRIRINDTEDFHELTREAAEVAAGILERNSNEHWIGAVYDAVKAITQKREREAFSDERY